MTLKPALEVTQCI